MKKTTENDLFNGSVAIKKSFLLNPDLSLKAKGVMATILLMKDSHEITEVALTSYVTDGINGVRSAVKELEEHGYLKRERLRNKNGKLQGSKWTIIENSEH